MVKYGLKACCALLILAFSTFAWTAGSITVDVVNSPMNIKVSANANTLLEITGISFGTTNYTSILSINQATDSLVINLAANQSITIKPVLSGIHVTGSAAGASTVKITMKDENDHFFGITEQNTYGNSPDIRGRTVVISNSNIQNLSEQPNAKVWSAFYMSSLGYGSFFNSFAEGTYVFGVGGVTSITHNTDTIDWYIYYGPTGDKIHQGYFKTIQNVEGLGTRSPTKKVPIWACGLVIWHNNYSGSAQVLSHITNFTSNQIPITAQWVDRPYSNGTQGWGQMDWSSAFANPATWIRQISSDTGYNVKEMSWVAPCAFGTSDPKPPVYFSPGYYYFDLSSAATVAWYVQRLDSLQEKVGIQGHKMDRCEESMTEVLSGTWSDGTPTTQKQCKYLYLNAKTTDQVLRTIWGDNQFNFPRGAYHRCQPYIGAVWGGDTRAPWAGLVGALANGIKTAFCGFPVWGSDIGGYGTGATKIAKDQYLRWEGMACFCGMMENMLDGKEPYIYTAAGDTVAGQTFVSRYKAYADLRMSLIPYTYSLANNSANTGTAMRPLPYVYPTDAATYTIGDEFMYGPAFLVAPITSATMTRSVYLPAGTWYNFFNTTEVHAAGTFTTATVPLYQQPVYIRANSVYVTGQIYPGNSKRWMTNYDSTRNVVINAFPGSAGENDTFTYVDYLAADSQKVITLQSAANNVVKVVSPAMTVSGKVMIRLAAAPTNVYLNGVALTSSQYTYTPATLMLAVPFAAQQAINVQVSGMPTGIVYAHAIPVLNGKLQVRISANGADLIVPAVQGIGQNSRMEVSVYNAQGKCVKECSVGSEQSLVGGTQIPLGRMGSGMYVASVKVDGSVLQRSKILIP